MCGEHKLKDRMGVAGNEIEELGRGPGMEVWPYPLVIRTSK